MRIVLGLALLGCAGARRKAIRSGELGKDRNAAAKSGTWKTHFDQLMSEVMKTDNPDGISPVCQPYVTEPQGVSRGLVILQHGFTACAGFWYNVAPPVVADGWTVAVPNLPGTGRAPKIEQVSSTNWTVTDWTDDIPEWGIDYEEYAQELVQIAQKYKAENPSLQVTVVGCSHGGAVATYMAMNANPGTFDRVLLMNPFLAPPTGLGADFGISVLRDLIPQLLPSLKPIVGDLGWGGDCDERRWPTDTRGTSGGVCTFTLENFRGVLEFANNVEGEARARAAQHGLFTGGIVDRALGRAQAAAGYAWEQLTGNKILPPSNLRVQIVTTEHDGAISNARVHFAAEAVAKQVTPGNAAMCAFPEVMAHTFINPRDKASDFDMWWMDSKRVTAGKSVVDMLVDFITSGVFVPTSGTAQSDTWLEGDPACDMSEKH